MTQLGLLPAPKRPEQSREAYLPGDRGDPPRRAGKIQPRRFSALTMLKATPGVIPGFFNKRVPDEFWARDADSLGPIAIVACPCGEEVAVPEGQMEDCDCGRWYLNAVDRVLIGASD